MLLRAGWVVVLVVLTSALVLLRAIEAPGDAHQLVATALGITLAVGLAHRSGGHVLLAAALAVVLGSVAVTTEWEPLVAGAAMLTGVLAGCLAVLGTTPAASFPAVVREVVLAQLLAGAGALGVAGFAVRLDAERFTYTVLVAAVLATIVLVYRLGGGLHALGRRGLLLAAAALVLLVVVLVYTAALTRHGSPELVAQVRSAQIWTREHLGGVPHPVEVLIGVPALAWGVSMRSRRRQGWWVCAFGVAATAAATTRLLSSPWLSAGLATVYSVALGLVLGYALIRGERVFARVRGRPHPRDDEPPLGLREEPGRLHALH